MISRPSEEQVRAFVPPPLPPKPPIKLDDLQVILEQANQALGRLDGLASMLPDRNLLIYAYVRKEAVLSLQIEGTRSSLSDILLLEAGEAPGVPIEDVTSPRLLTDCGGSARASHYRCGLSARSMECCSQAGEAATKNPASFVAVKIGSVERDRVTPSSYPRHRSW